MANSRKKKNRIFSENEITSFNHHDNYKRQKLLKDSICYISVFLAVSFSLIVTINLILDTGFRTVVLDQIKNSIGVIVVSMASILGISISSKRDIEK